MGFLDGIDQYLSGIFGSSQSSAPPVPPQAAMQMPPVQTLEAQPSAGPGGFPPVAGMDSGPTGQAQPSTATPGPIQPPPPTFPNGQVPMPQPNPNALPPSSGPTAGPPMSLAPPNPGGAPQPPPSLPPQASPPMPQPRPQAPPGGGPANNPVLNALFSQSNMQGVGKGLASVAQNWNKPGLAAFAGSAGATMEGQAAANQEEQKHTLATRKQNFDEMSNSFKDWIAAKQQDSTEKMRDAQTKYLGARAEAIMNGASTGGTGNNAMLNTPFGKMVTIDKMVDARKESEAKTMREANKGRTPDEQSAAQKDLDGKYEQLRQQQYQKYGINPQAAEQMKKMGTGAPVKNSDGTFQKNPDGSYVFPQDSPPFDTRNMTIEQFNSHVPVGAYYVGNDGKAYKRTQAPGLGKQSEAAPNYDDMQAMSAS